MARDTRRPASSGPALQLIPAATGFDFLEGAFRASQRARQVFLSFALAAVVGVGVLVMLGLAATVGTSMDRTTLSTLGGGASGMLSAHVDKREAAVEAAVGDEVDVPALLQALQSATPGGVTLTGITLGAPETAAPAATDDAPATPAADLTITARVSSLPQVSEFQSSLATVDLITDVKATWSGTVPSVTVTVTATIADAAHTSRAQAVTAPTSAGAPAQQPGN
jgi:hypothetical protein